jgi:hypothetical protein
LPALLLPDGHLRSRRWWLVVVTSVTGIVLVTVAGPLAPGPLDATGIDDPFGLAGPAGKVAAVLTVVGIVLHWLSLPPAVLCVVLRFRSSRGVERQQLRWVAAGVACAVGGLLVALPAGLGFAPGWISGIVFPALLCPPLAVGVAVLRHRLYDLDRIISRTLAYGLLTVLLAAATTPPAPWRRSRPACATRSTSTPCTASCWAWSTRPCSRPGRRCGCGARRGSPRVPVVGAVGYARGRRRPAPDLLPGAHATGPRR